MATTTSIPNPAQMIITLEDNALVADVISHWSSNDGWDNDWNE